MPVATHYIPPGIPGFEEAGGYGTPKDPSTGKPLDFLANPNGDMQLAESYMKKAGFSSGKCEGSTATSPWSATTRRRGPTRPRSCKDQLEKLGFNVNLQKVEHSSCTRSSASREVRAERLSERRLAEGLQRWSVACSTCRSPDRPSRQSGEQLQLAAAQRPDDQQGDRQVRERQSAIRSAPSAGARSTTRSRRWPPRFHGSGTTRPTSSPRTSPAWSTCSTPTGTSRSPQ